MSGETQWVADSDLDPEQRQAMGEYVTTRVAEDGARVWPADELGGYAD